MNITIEQTNELSDADKLTLWGWGDDIFQTRDYALQWRPKDLHLIARLSDGTAVSKVSVLRHTLEVRSRELTVGGVGGVVTVPTMQKQGLARLLMDRAVTVMRDEMRVSQALLFCLEFMRPYYASLGWKLITDPVLIEQPEGRRVSPVGAMAYSLGAEQFPNGEIQLNSAPW